MTPTTLPEHATSVQDQLDQLALFEPTSLPVISLYLNTQPDSHGHDHYELFLRKELLNRGKSWPASSSERESFDQDVTRIQTYLENELKPSSNGLALFACHGAGLFQAVQLNVPVDEHRVYVYNQPHLFHLAWLDDAYPRYAALLTDANSARIFVFGLGETADVEEVTGKKVQRVKVGGWSQARYQRRVENAHRDHAKEAIDTLDKIVRQERIQHVILAADPAMVPVLKEQLPKHLHEKLVDVFQMDTKASEQQILQATLEKMREQDANTDAEKVERLFSQARSHGLAVLGPQETLEALANGQVDEVLLSAELERTHPNEEPVEAILAPELPDAEGSTETDGPRPALLADLLVTHARQTSARVSFIEDASLLASVDGVGAFLRWRN